MDPNNAGGNEGGGNEGNRPAWMASLPDSHKGNERLAQFAEPSHAWDKFDSYLSAEAEGKLLTIPGEKATDDERKAFYNKIGVPEGPDKYEFDDLRVEQYTAEADKMFRELMLNSNVPKSAAKGIHKAFVEMIKQGVEASAKAEADRQAADDKALNDAVNTLKDQWKGNEFKANTELAHRAYMNVLKWAGINEAEGNTFLSDTKIGNLSLGDHPMILKMFAAVASKISGDNAGGFRGGGGGEKSDEDKARDRFPNTQFTS